MAEERKDLTAKIEETNSVMNMLKQMTRQEKEQIMMFAAGMRAARELYKMDDAKKPA